MKIGTDKYSYLSSLKDVDPTAKLTAAMVSLTVCLCADGLAVGVLTTVFFCVLTARRGGTSAQVFLSLMRAPLLFVLLGTVTLLFSRFPSYAGVLIGVRIGSWIYGVSWLSLYTGAQMIIRAMGCIASVYFLMLTTPVTDLMLALRRMHIPQLFLSLMELIYRFIFVLYDTATRIYIAQVSRLGYVNLRHSLRSFGELLSAVFLRAYQKSDKIYIALDARGYEGGLSTLPPLYTSGRAIYGWCAALTVAQIAVILLERGVVPR